MQKKLIPVVVFTVLTLIGAWGHRTHWDFAHLVGPAHPDTDESRESALPDPTTASSKGSAIHEIQLEDSQASKKLGIKVVNVQYHRLQREIEAAARVTYDPSRVAQLTSCVAGTVWRAEKRVGQPIHRGESLAIIESLQVGQAKAELLRCIADVGLKQKMVNRLRSIRDGDIPFKHVEQAEVDLRKARLDLFDSEQRLNNLGLPIDAKMLDTLEDDELLIHVKFLGLPKTLVQTLDAKSSTANLLPLYAPFDGLVIGQDMVNGEVVSPLEGGFEIADVERMQIRLNVREEDAQKLRLGQRVAFQSGNISVATAITWISTEVDSKTRMIEARCEAENPPLLDESGSPLEQRALRANMFGIARIQIEEKPTAVVVPTTAVQWTGRTHIVFVRRGESAFEVRNVDVGIATDKLTELIHGVELGECVANEGSYLLKTEAMRLWPFDGA